MKRYITTTTYSGDQCEDKELVPGFFCPIQQQNLRLLSDDVTKFSELANIAATPLVNAYFLAGIQEIEYPGQGGFFRRDRISGFNAFTKFMEKFNPVLKQVLGFKLVDVPI